MIAIVRLFLLFVSDTERIHTEICEKVASKYGSQYTWDMKVRLTGRPAKQGSKIAVEMMKLPITPDEFIAEMQIHKDELFATAKLLPGMILFLIIYLYIICVCVCVCVSFCVRESIHRCPQHSRHAQ